MVERDGRDSPRAATATAPEKPPSAVPGILRFVARRTLAGVVTVFVASVLIFFGMAALPGDTATMVLSRNATPENVANLQARLGLDRPIVEQYLDWFSGALQGDLGDSAVAIAQGAVEASITERIAEPLRNTAVLAIVTLVLLLPSAVALGVMTARRVGRAFDHSVSGTALVLTSIPEYVVATGLLVVFFVWLDVLPPTSLLRPGESPFDHPEQLVLPVLTILAISLAWTMRLIRASMIDALASDYANYARLSGFSENHVVWRVSLRNCFAPTVQIFAMAAQILLGGVLITETVFAFPGLGVTFVRAISAQDLPLVQSLALLLSTLYVFTNLVADLIVTLIVPRLRTGLAQ